MKTMITVLLAVSLPCLGGENENQEQKRELDHRIQTSFQNDDFDPEAMNDDQPLYDAISQRMRLEMGDGNPPLQHQITNQMVMECAQELLKNNQQNQGYTLEQLALVFAKYSAETQKGWTLTMCQRIANHLMNGDDLD